MQKGESPECLDHWGFLFQSAVTGTEANRLY